MCIHSWFIYFLYVLYFIPNLNEIESEMVPRNKNMTHNCAHSAQQAWTTHHEVAQHKGCYFGRHSKSTPKCATSAHRFYSDIVGKQYVAHELEVDGGTSLCFVTYVSLVCAYSTLPGFSFMSFLKMCIIEPIKPLAHAAVSHWKHIIIVYVFKLGTGTRLAIPTKGMASFISLYCTTTTNNHNMHVQVTCGQTVCRGTLVIQASLCTFHWRNANMNFLLLKSSFTLLEDFLLEGMLCPLCNSLTIAAHS